MSCHCHGCEAYAVCDFNEGPDLESKGYVAACGLATFDTQGTPVPCILEDGHTGGCASWDTLELAALGGARLE